MEKREELPEVRLVFCRRDLPENPRAEEWGYPDRRCWDTIEIMMEAQRSGESSSLWHEARRIYWEMMHRGYGTYRGRHPFPEVYWCNVKEKRCTKLDESDPSVQRLVMMEIISSAMQYGVGRRGVGVFREILGRPIARR